MKEYNCHCFDNTFLDTILINVKLGLIQKNHYKEDEQI